MSFHRLEAESCNEKLKGWRKTEHDHHRAAPDIPAGTETAKDPVCGMAVAIKPDARRAAFQGETFHFCSEKCQTKFKADPWFHAWGRAADHNKAAPTNVQYARGQLRMSGRPAIHVA